MPPAALLGPQRLRSSLDEAVAALGLEGRIATITCGWEELELEDDELAAALDRPTVNLRLFRRAERAFASDPGFFDAWGDRRRAHDRLHEVYRLRLDHALEAVRELSERRERVPEAGTALEDAYAQVRELDRRQLEIVGELNARFDEEYDPIRRPSVRREREEIAAELEGCAGIAVAGGDVGVLVRVLRLFNMLEHLERLPVIAWSAGAMALAERIVLFHDRPPQGFGYAEIHDAGLGLWRGVVPFPHARRRLNLNDPLRIEMLARRLAPLDSAVMDEPARIEWDGTRVTAAVAVRRLTADGGVEPVRVAAAGGAP